jgi:cycloeucalenol cycloisomerase
MASIAYPAEPEEFRTFTEGRKWFSENDDKAWAEKFYLIFIPIFFAYNAVIQNMGWLNVGNFWHVTQNLLMWVPYCIILPLILRRNSPLPFYKQWWFKFQLYMAVLVFFVTYFHTEYFFDVLGMRYHFPKVSLYFDSVLLGPNQAKALAADARIPIGMYLNTMAFFTVYHIASVVVIRRIYNLVKNLTGGVGPDGRPTGVQRVAFVIAVAATALFFAWAETFFYMTAPAHDNVWYIDLKTQLYIGSIFYAMDFIFTFPNIYRLDESRRSAPWTLPRIAVEAAAMAMFILLADDLWTMFYGMPFATR